MSLIPGVRNIDPRGFDPFVMAALVPAIVRPQAYHIREVKVPFRNTCFRPVADRDRVTVRWRGKQREANRQSVG